MQRGLEAYQRELEKERFAMGRKARSATSSRAKSNRSRSMLSGDSEKTDVGARTRRSPLSSDLSRPLLSSSPPPANSRVCLLKRGRRVPAAVARAVYARDEKQCTFVSRDGRRCRVRRFLELDHVLPWAVGGEHTTENLQVRCAAHNRRAAKHYFGKAYIRVVIERRRRAAREA